MEVLIALGRDSLVSYQNEASAKLKALRLGASLIRNTLGCPLRKSAIRFSVARRSAFRTGRFSSRAVKSCSLGTIAHCKGQMARSSELSRWAGRGRRRAPRSTPIYPHLFPL